MTEKSKHCVDAAIAYANLPKQEGDAFSLRVELKNGSVVEGPYSEFDGYPDTLLIHEPTGLGNPAEVFINKHEIVKATIVW